MFILGIERVIFCDIEKCLGEQVKKCRKTGEDCQYSLTFELLRIIINWNICNVRIISISKNFRLCERRSSYLQEYGGCDGNGRNGPLSAFAVCPPFYRMKLLSVCIKKGITVMRIKLAILEKDQSYLARIVTAFNTKYADKFEIYSFTDKDIALATLESSRIDVLIASDSFTIDAAAIPGRCGFAYFVDSMDVESVNDQRAICKFQKADLIYKQILSIYSESSGRASGLKLGDDNARVVAFASPCGGVGTSSLAAAFAIRMAKQGKKALYLNLEKFGSSDVYFAGEGQFDMSDIIFSLKSRRANFGLKLESYVKQDHTGVYFYSQAKFALDMMELGKEEILKLISELKLMGAYDYIVVDMEFSLSKDALDVFRTMNNIVMVGDGSDISNMKIFRAYNALVVLEQNKDDSLLNRISLIYNKFSNKTSKAIEGIEIYNIGGAPRYEHATTEQVVNQLANMSIYDKIS